jgi:hypothetical protein
MKIKKTIRFRFSRDVSQHIANFGTARLVKKSDGRHELIGGTADDHAAAREWCSALRSALRRPVRHGLSAFRISAFSPPCSRATAAARRPDPRPQPSAGDGLEPRPGQSGHRAYH